MKYKCSLLHSVEDLILEAFFCKSLIVLIMYCERLISVLVALFCSPPPGLEGMSFRPLALNMIPVDVFHIPFSSVIWHPSNYVLWETCLYLQFIFFLLISHFYHNEVEKESIVNCIRGQFRTKAMFSHHIPSHKVAISPLFKCLSLAANTQN